MHNRTAALLAVAIVAVCGCESRSVKNGREGLSFIAYKLTDAQVDMLPEDTRTVYQAIASKEIDTGTDLTANLFAACSKAGEVVEHDREIISWQFNLEPDRPLKEQSRFAFVTYNIRLHKVRECGTDTLIR